jgi:hypothetical protein
MCDEMIVLQITNTFIQTKIHPNNKQQQKWPVSVGLNTANPSSKNKPWVEKLKKQSKSTSGFVSNPEGVMMMVTKAMEMENNLENFIYLIPGKTKAIKVIHSCLTVDKNLGNPWNPGYLPHLWKSWDGKLARRCSVWSGIH